MNLKTKRSCIIEDRKSVAAKDIKQKIMNINPIDEEKYLDIDLDRLLLYACWYLTEEKISLSQENIMVATFKMFSKKFGLIGYSEYPDGHRLHSTIWHLYAAPNKKTGRAIRGWLKGNRTKGFILTELGKKEVFNVTNMLFNGGEKRKAVKSKSRRQEKIIYQHVLNSDAYRKFKNGQDDDISEFDLCRLLQCPIDASKGSLANNIISLKLFAEEIDSKEALEFIKFLKKKFEYFLQG